MVKQYTGVGAVLRDTREEHGIALEEVAKRTNIRIRYLKLIETGEFDQLPGKTYTLGYIKKYSSYLGFNTVEIVNMFTSERSGGNNSEMQFMPEPAIERSKPPLLAFAVSLLLGLAMLGMWYWLSQHTDPSDFSYMPEPPEPPSSSQSGEMHGPPELYGPLEQP